MKFPCIFFGVCIFFCSCKSWDKTIVERKTAAKTNKEMQSFLTTTWNAHRLLLEQGKLLRDRGTSATIRDYGILVVRDEETLIFKIEEMSRIENVKLSTRLNAKKEDELTSLKELKEKDFDRKSLKIIDSRYRQKLAETERILTTNVSANMKALVECQIAVMQFHTRKIELLRQEQAEKHFSVRAKYRAWNRGYVFSLILGQLLI